jgi:catechol 2,3-dioxygenase-like lactoylglutathione lyase family enzyme
LKCTAKGDFVAVAARLTCPRKSVRHLALAVRDQERSRRFYETYFGFDSAPARQYDDGVLMLYNADGFALGLGPTDEPIRMPEFFHFGVGVASPDDVRAFAKRLRADGVPIVGEWDEPDYVSVKCRDPDGYVVELAWEPD